MSAIAEERPIERRESCPESSDIWENLTLAQKFAVSSLTQFGYELAFIRDCHANSLAVLTCNDCIATISKAGEINTSPSIKMRH